MAAARTDYDSPWKEMLERYFPQFLAFFFRDIHAAVDWSRPHEFLESELQQVVREAEIGRRRVDKLVRVWRRNGQERWVLIHVEVQGQQEADFARRMYIYNYRIFDRYERQVASLAVLTDENKDWRPGRYVYNLWGSRAGLEFRTAKLLDWRNRWEELEQNRNPFAVVVMAHLKTLETRGSPQDRKLWKFTLTRMLYEREYSREDVLELFRFIDWLMVLPPELDEQFEVELAAYEEAQHMRYVTTIEQRAEQRGIEQGIEQNLRENIATLLEERFRTVPAEVMSRLAQIDDAAVLRILFRQAITVESPAAFAEVLAQTTDRG